MPERFHCKDFDGVVHSISNDPYTDDLKVCCGRNLHWGGRQMKFVSARLIVSESPGPTTCMACIACESEV